MDNENLPLLDCPKDFILGDASGRLMNEYARFPCKIKCGVYAYMAAGSAKATLNITQLDFHEHDMLYMEPGSFLLIHEFSEDARVYYLVLSSTFLEKNTYGIRHISMTNRKSIPILHLSAAEASVVMNFFNLLSECANVSPKTLDVESMVHIFNMMQHMFVMHLNAFEGLNKQTQDRKSEIYDEFCDLVMKHYHEWHHVASYAEQMRLTVPHLSSSIKQAGNRTAGDIIVEAILMDAKAQLKITAHPIKEIAAQLGFENVAFFNRFFKTHVGVTPKTYRKE